jgi:two-component system C4-dicarboxylate transport response regulator DctD
MDHMEKCSILLVDDDQNILKALGKYFERLGHVVHRAESGKEALSVHERMRPDVTVLDVFMPGMSGLEVLEVLRGRGAVVVMLTGQGEVEVAVQAMKLGAENFLTKPVDMDHLMATIEKAAEKAVLKRENVEMKQRLRPNMKRTLLKVVMFSLLVLAAAIVGKMIGGTTDVEDPRAVIPVPFDTSNNAGTPPDSSATPNRD